MGNSPDASVSTNPIDIRNAYPLLASSDEASRAGGGAHQDLALLPRPTSAPVFLGEPDASTPPPAHNTSAPTISAMPSALSVAAVSTLGGQEIDVSPALQPESDAASPRRAARVSFLQQERAVPLPTTGTRGALSRLGVPLRLSAAELAQRENARLVSQSWSMSRKIAVVNGKGGVGKTMTTAMLASVFATFGGSGVLAWDNNDTRGTLGWRTEKAAHDATVRNLLPEVEGLLSPSAQSSGLARFVHHQPDDKYDVLRSNPELLAVGQRLGRDDFDRLHDVAAKYFRVVLFDSGNDESAARWLRMIDHTDQLVVPTLAAGESAESAALLLEALEARGGHSSYLARNAVVIVSQSERWMRRSEVSRIAARFSELSRATVTVPFDRGLRAGQIRFAALRPATRRAWLAAAAAVAKGL